MTTDHAYTQCIQHLSDLRVGPCSTTFESSHLVPTTDFIPDIILNFSTSGSFFCVDQPNARLIAGLCNGSKECYGESIFRGLLVIPGVIRGFLHPAPFFA
jgi:hypothetical protein